MEGHWQSALINKTLETESQPQVESLGKIKTLQNFAIPNSNLMEKNIWFCDPMEEFGQGESFKGMEVLTHDSIQPE